MYELLVARLGRDSNLMAGGSKPQSQSDVRLHFAPRTARGNGYPHLSCHRLAATGARPGIEGGTECGSPQREVAYQSPVRVLRAVAPQQRLAKVDIGYNQYQFVQDAADQEPRVLDPVIVDLQYPTIGVDRPGARVGAEAEGDVATVSQALKLVARPQEFG